jgi:hypothetical protein
MIGYFRVESIRVGVYMSPWMSVFPSRAFTVKGVGGFQPLARSREMSAFSSDITTLPFASRGTVTGGSWVSSSCRRSTCRPATA